VIVSRSIHCPLSRWESTTWIWWTKLSCQSYVSRFHRLGFSRVIINAVNLVCLECEIIFVGFEYLLFLWFPAIWFVVLVKSCACVLAFVCAWCAGKQHPERIILLQGLQYGNPSWIVKNPTGMWMPTDDKQVCEIGCICYTWWYCWYELWVELWVVLWAVLWVLPCKCSAYVCEKDTFCGSFTIMGCKYYLFVNKLASLTSQFYHLR
jgi:hypothetical protein